MRRAAHGVVTSAEELGQNGAVRVVGTGSLSLPHIMLHGGGQPEAALKASQPALGFASHSHCEPGGGRCAPAVYTQYSVRGVRTTTLSKQGTAAIGLIYRFWILEPLLFS